MHVEILLKKEEEEEGSAVFIARRRARDEFVDIDLIDTWQRRRHFYAFASFARHAVDDEGKRANSLACARVDVIFTRRRKQCADIEC